MLYLTTDEQIWDFRDMTAQNFILQSTKSQKKLCHCSGTSVQRSPFTVAALTPEACRCFQRLQGLKPIQDILNMCGVFNTIHHQLFISASSKVAQSSNDKKTRTKFDWIFISVWKFKCLAVYWFKVLSCIFTTLPVRNQNKVLKMWFVIFFFYYGGKFEIIGICCTFISVWGLFKWNTFVCLAPSRKQ